MSRRRMMMMMMNRVVNLFDKNSGDIVFNARLNNAGGVYTKDYVAKAAFISPYISVIPLKTYVLIRKIINSDSDAYNRWCFYDSTKKIVSNKGNLIETNIITIPENCYYIRFNGSITDIDNVKFYKV